MNTRKWTYQFTLPFVIPSLFFLFGPVGCSQQIDTAPAHEKEHREEAGVHPEKRSPAGEREAPSEGHHEKHPERHEEKEPHVHKGPSPKTQEPESRRVSLSPEERANIGLKTVPVEMRLVEDVRLLNGVVKPHPDRVALVTSRVAGRAADIHVNVGDRVKKGQDLADVQSAELEKIELELIQAENRLALAQADLERIRALVEKGIAAQKDLLAAESHHQAVKNEIESLTRRLVLLGMPEAEIRKVRREKTVSTLHIHAPIAGTIVERHVVLGQTIEPEKPLFKILDDSVMLVEGDAFEDILPLLNLGQPVRVRIPAYPNQVFEGRITFIGPTVDPQKRTVPVWVQLRNHDGMLKQNLFADLSVVMGENHGSLAIPLEGLMSAEGGDFVFVEQDGVFLRRDLVLGARDDQYVEVKKGLEAGDRVVTDGRRQLYTRYLMMQRGGVDLGGHAH